jgi:glycosyltransferase involved in cell wall biosynthesis
LGVSGGTILPFVRLFTSRRIITNIDGLEWKREKWGRFAAWFLKISEGFAVRYSDVVISDNKAISDYVKDEYCCDSSLISYGGDHLAISELPVEKDNFFLGLCRIEPENNVEMILESFSINGESLKFIGNWSNSDYSCRLRLKYSNFSNIELIDPIYELDDLFHYRSRCKGYVHGHSAGGTNPSLVEMMHFDTSIVCFDCSYNRETTENNACYFSSADQLTDLVLNGLVINGSIMRDIASRRYTWEIVRQQYERLY